MKRKLFLVAVAAMVGLSLNAQSWTPQAPADGDFYLYNVGTGKFLSCGEDWGTHAVVGNGALKFTLANNGSGAYTLYTTSTFSYGNPNSAQLQSSGYVDQNVTATTWTFTEVGGQANTYTLQNAAGTYLYAPNDGTIKIQLKSDAPSDNYGYWKLINLEHLYDNARLDNPIDVTCLIGDANFESSKTSEFGWTMVASNQNLCGGASPNKCAESYRSLFTLSKVLDGVPNGEYELTAQGFYRQDGSDNEHLPVFYINEKTATFPLRTGSEGSMSAASASFTNGLYTIAPIRVTVGDGKITLGTKLEGNTMLWCIWDNFTLKYYGVDLSAYEEQITTLRSTLSSLIAQPMKATVLTAANTALTETESVAYTESAMETAIAQLNTAIDNVNTSIANYVEAKAYLDKSSTLDAAGQASYAANETVSAVQTAYNDRTIEALSNEQKAAMDAAIIVAVKAQTTPGSDWTLAIVNPSFENGFSSGWTNTGMAIQNNASFPKDGNNYCEKWEPNGTFSVTQTINGMPSGVYRLTVKAKTRSVSSGKVFAGGIETATKIADEVNTYVVEFACDDDADITIGLEGTGTGVGASWIALDDFHLTLVSAGLPDVVAVTGKMNNDVAAAQTSAINTYNENKTVANYNAASAAISAAQASKDAYTAANTAITKANAIKTNHNFASATAVTTFATAIGAIEDAYDAGTLADEAASNAGLTLGVSVSGWRGNNNAAASVYLRNGFALGDFQNDPALHVNTWSTEGDNDGTGFSVPFYESWTSDANSLPNSTISGTLTDLPNGLYEVSAWVRVRTKNGAAATDATGITMDVNGGGEGDYAAVDVTEGAQIGESQFQMQTYTAQNLVKDGNLTLNFNIVDDNNISWLSFKNVHYTKVRDLTPEEAAIIPTAIALDQTEVALDATNSSKTFELTFTPIDATQTVNWTSSDESVATVSSLGEVTAVLPGTATITATSTLDANVSASATVTVTFPETVTPASYYVNNDATRTVYTVGDNLIKNGTFEYPDGFYGWTDATAGAAKLTSSNFDIVTDGENKYLRSKNHGGSTSASSIGTAWPIEAGKTYVFGYKAKAVSAGTTEYHVVSLTNTLATETFKISTTQTVGTAWTDIQYTFTNSSNYAYLQFRARWLGENGQLSSFDDFYLAEVTPATEGNVDYATAAIPTANIGTGAFQYSQDAIDNANALVQGVATVQDVEDAYSALKTVNAPENGQVFHVILTYAGYQYDNKAITYLANGRADAGLYNIQYKEEANTNLAQAFTFTKVSGNNYKMSQIDADGNVRYLCTGVPYSGNTSQIRTTTNAENALVVTVIPTANEGKWNLWNTEANQYIGSQDAGVYTVNSHIDFNIVETSKPSITINTTAAGWGTTMLPFAVASLPDGVKAYRCYELSGATLVLDEVDALAANTPYIIEGAWNETLNGDAQGISLTYNVGLLTGVYAATPALNGTYVLQNNDSKIGFYLVNTGVATPTVGANRCYLTVPAGVKANAFFFNDATGIQNVLENLQAGEIYDISGRKLGKLQKGVNIVNGKKVLVK